MYRHLVTIEVCVVGCTDQRVQLNRLTFDQHRLECLNTKTVQCRRPVEQHRVFADHFSQDIPDFGGFLFHHFLGGFNGCRQTTCFQLTEDEWLEQFQRHLLRQTALVQSQRRANYNHGSTRVINALTEQILTESTLFTLDHVSQRLERALVSTCDSTTATTIIEQRINGFLQHALFVSDDDIRRSQIEQALQSIVTVDHATVQVIQVRRCKTSTFERYQRTQIRRQHRQNIQNHPLWLVA